jgi:phage/plasmid-associated DNA primase
LSLAKGVIARIVTELLGPENVTTLRTRSLDGRFEIGRFVKKFLLYAPDVNSRFLHENGAYLLKAISGEDPFSPEYKGSNVTPPAMPLGTGILITCNSRLTIHLEGDRGAYERRLIVISFDREGVAEEKRISGLSGTLMQEEGSGILNWALEGLQAFVLNDLKLALNERQRAVVSDLLSESESCTCFARECIEREDGATLTASRAYKAYVRFCSSRVWPPLAEVKFNREFKIVVQSTFGITQSHDIREGSKVARGWRGLLLCERE